MCKDDDYMHAKRNDKDVPQNSRRRKDTEGVAQFCQSAINDDRTVVLSLLSIKKWLTLMKFRIPSYICAFSEKWCKVV